MYYCRFNLFFNIIYTVNNFFFCFSPKQTNKPSIHLDSTVNRLAKPKTRHESNRSTKESKAHEAPRNVRISRPSSANSWAVTSSVLLLLLGHNRQCFVLAQGAGDDQPRSDGESCLEVQRPGMMNKRWVFLREWIFPGIVWIWNGSMGIHSTSLNIFIPVRA
jgi:hypothetical protein